MGHLLYLLGEVSDKTIKKYEREAEKIGKSSFRYAWVLDETDEERSRYVICQMHLSFHWLETQFANTCNKLP